MRYVIVLVAIMYCIYASTVYASQSVNVKWTPPDPIAVGMAGYKAYMINIATNEIIIVANNIPASAVTASINYSLIGTGEYYLVLTAYTLTQESPYSDPCVDPLQNNARVIFKDQTPPATMRQAIVA